MVVENGKKSGDDFTDLERPEKKEQEQGSHFYVYYLTCFATIGGLLFGYDTGIISGSMLLIGDVFQLSTIWKELIVSATVGAAAVFALVAGFLTDLIGRKRVVMLASFIFTIGAVVMGAANGKIMLLIGRLVVGWGIGKFMLRNASLYFTLIKRQSDDAFIYCFVSKRPIIIYFKLNQRHLMFLPVLSDSGLI